MASITIPVWRDYDMAMPSTPQDYAVKDGADTIYTGRAYARPGEASPKVRINEIAAPLLANPFPLVGDYTQQVSNIFAADILKTLKVYNGGGTQIGDDLIFAYDWSGEGDNNAVVGMSSAGGHRPIVAKAVQDMPLILTLFNNAPVLHEGVDDVEVETPNSIDSPFAWDIPGNYVLGKDWWPEDAIANGDDWIRWGPNRYTLIPACRVRYVLYYLNAFGCWDSLPLEGKCREGRDYDRHNLKVVYDNSDALARGLVNYRNGETRRWTLRTGWVDALGVSRMPHLIGSPSVYLMDTAERVTHPVVITDTAVEERQYDDELAPVVYTINVQGAREGERR